MRRIAPNRRRKSPQQAKKRASRLTPVVKRDTQPKKITVSPVPMVVKTPKKPQSQPRRPSCSQSLTPRLTTRPSCGSLPWLTSLWAAFQLLSMSLRPRIWRSRRRTTLPTRSRTSRHISRRFTLSSALRVEVLRALLLHLRHVCWVVALGCARLRSWFFITPPLLFLQMFIRKKKFASFVLGSLCFLYCCRSMCSPYACILHGPGTLCECTAELAHWTKMLHSDVYP